jgi:F-type H+-transporting ATPase subunit delta
MISGSIARRYARALFSLAVDADRIEPWSSVFASLRVTFRDNRELRDALTNPVYTAEQRRAVVAKLAHGLALDPEPTNLMLLLADRNRLVLLDAVAEAFGELADQKLGRVRARVISAVPLEQGEATRLAERLAGAAKAQVIVEREVDPSILGGVVAHVGNTVYDGSLRSQLEDLGRALKR